MHDEILMSVLTYWKEFEFGGKETSQNTLFRKTFQWFLKLKMKDKWSKVRNQEKIPKRDFIFWLTKAYFS